MRLGFIFLLVPFLLLAQKEEVHEYMDLQIHPTMHVPYGFFDEFKYFEEGEEPKLKYKHSFKNVIYANYLRQNKGLQIIVNGALTNEKIKSKKKARRLIVEQIELMDQFAEDHPEDFVVARSPQDVRDLVKTTDKTIIIHSIEGARKVINSKEDAEFYAKKGVAFVTLIHLTDYKYGGAAIKPAFVTKLINFKGLFRKKRKRGLTEKGKKAILWLANAGIMTDITHMSDQTRIDALDFMEEKGLKPLSTHDGFKPIQNHPRGIDTASVLKIYKLGGLMSLPISGESLKAHKIQEPYKSMLDSLEKAGCHCEGSIDSYRFTYEALKDYLHQHSSYFYGDSLYCYEDLPDSAKTELAIGFQTDFNGWLNHHRPTVGKKGCEKLEEGKVYEKIETDGMPHPGYMESHWRWLEKEGVDLDPVKRSSEKFLQMWEFFLEHKGSWLD